MAASAMPFVETHGVSGQEALHETAEVPSGCFHQQVNVVGHQADQVNANPILLGAVFQTAKHVLPVPVIPEEIASLITTKGHVVDRAGIFKPYSPGHLRSLLALFARGKS
jgi:hypothetical protein